MFAIAAHAVSPTCPYCSRPVRPSIELNAAVAVVVQVLATAIVGAQSGHPDDLEALEVTSMMAVTELEMIAAEFAGEHAGCSRLVDTSSSGARGALPFASACRAMGGNASQSRS